MKVTIQNGSAHGLSRSEVEAMVPLFPQSWKRVVKQIVLYQGSGSALKAEFYPKEQLLGLFWPSPADAATKSDGVEELLLSLAVAEERGELPKRLSKALRERHLSAVAEIRERCLQVVADNAV
jgi:hypothetical protein